MKAFAMLPADLQATLKEHGQVMNIPHVGHPNNCVFPNVQMNIAFPVCETSSGMSDFDAMAHLSVANKSHDRSKHEKSSWNIWKQSYRWI
jgi:hypothetical protein